MLAGFLDLRSKPLHCDVAAEKLEEISLGTHNYS